MKIESSGAKNACARGLCYGISCVRAERSHSLQHWLSRQLTCGSVAFCDRHFQSSVNIVDKILIGNK